MLRSIYINNIALIKSQTLDFCDGFNVLSGETGAGKSIIVDSLSLIMGEKFDRVLMRFGESVSRVEAVFDTTKQAEEILRSFDIDVDEQTIISRKFTDNGKTENRINGRTVTLSAVKTLGSALIDICGQNEYQFLSSAANHIKVLDAFSGTEIVDLRVKLSTTLSEIRQINNKLEEIQDAEDRADNIDYLKRKLSEIDKIKTYDGELEELEEKRRVYRSSGKIIAALSEAANAMSGGSDSILGKLRQSVKALSSVSDIGNEYDSLSERLNSCYIELEDVSDCIDSTLENIDVSESDIDALEDRLHKVRELMRKYGDYSGVVQKRSELAEKISFLENADEIYEELSDKKSELIKTAYDLSKRMSVIRSKAAKELEIAVCKELADLGMQNSVFSVKNEEFPDIKQSERLFTSAGLDKIEFYLSPNVGQPLKPLTKIISGGEQSRLMLALKVISGNSDEIPSLVFDEIDTGISGKIGLEVAKKLAVLSRNHQVLCVTHLPQIAAMADKNFFISKNAENGQTLTAVKELEGDGVIEEIARLSGGKDISRSAESNAKEMKKWSEDFKSAL